MEGYIIFSLCYTLTLGFFGVILNTTFIVLTIFKCELHTNYALFLCVIALENMLFCFDILISTLQPIVIWLDVDGNTALCVISGVIMITSGLATVTIQPLIAVNRYIAICHGQWLKQIFRPRNNILLAISTFKLSFVVALVFIFFGEYGRIFNLCAPKIAVPLATRLLLRYQYL